jgi:4-hydroxy-4-methyl-2-oxoglutarate aldolase
MATAIRNIQRAKQEDIDVLERCGVAMVHESQGQTGLLASNLRPIYRPVKIAGSAITCQVTPGDNWMMHVAAELSQPGDILVVAPSSPAENGYFGDLMGSSLRIRGVRGLVIDAGVRDIARLTTNGFPVWSKVVFSQGTVKETLGDVNYPLQCGGQLICPGDVIVADDDGVVVVRRDQAAVVAKKAAEKEAFENEVHQRLLAGELTLDILKMRERLAAKGFRYIDTEDDI